LNIGFREEFEFFSDEFDALSMRAIHEHDIGFDFVLITFVNFIDEIIDNGSFTRAGRSMKYNMWDFIGLTKIVQFFIDFIVNGQGHIVG
jgi:hypothetical protein